MMRPLLASLTLLATCGSLAITAAQAGTSEASDSAAGGVSRAEPASAWRAWPLTLSPAPGELALAEVSFHRAARGQSISASSLWVSVSGPFGDDYLAAGALRLRTGGAPEMLVLLVNRASPLLDPVSVRLRLTARGALGSPLVRRLADPFSRPAGARRPALCNLALHGSVLSASTVRPLHSRGQALAGFDAASALAQAYDVVCALPYMSSFEQAVEQPSPAPPSPVSPAPSPVPPAPSPAPPVGRLPGEGCVPAAHYACPGALASTSAGATADGERRAAAGAY